MPVKVRTPSARKIGFLSSSSAAPDSTLGTPSLSRQLRAYGYVEGRDLVIEVRRSEGVPDRLPRLAAELVALGVEVIVTNGGTSPALAAKQATGTVPIVVRGLDNPEDHGVVASLARPGGNVTGVANPGAELSAKRVELLKETVPGLANVAVLFHSDDAGQRALVRATEVAARALQVAPRATAVDALDQLDAVLAAAWRDRPEGLVELHGFQFYGAGFAGFGKLLDFAVEHRLPQIYNGAAYAGAGGLMALGENSEASWRIVARLVDRILKGASPSDLPVEVNSVFDLALNMPMARKLGLTFPENVLRQATEVIR